MKRLIVALLLGWSTLAQELARKAKIADPRIQNLAARH